MLAGGVGSWREKKFKKITTLLSGSPSHSRQVLLSSTQTT